MKYLVYYHWETEDESRCSCVYSHVTSALTEFMAKLEFGDLQEPQYKGWCLMINVQPLD